MEKQRNHLSPAVVMLAFVSACLIMIFNCFLIRSDYIAADSILEKSERSLEVKEGELVRFDIYPTSTRMNSIYLCFSDRLEEHGRLGIKIYENDDVIYDEEIDIDKCLYVDENDGQNIEILFKNTINVLPGNEYFVEIINNISDDYSHIKIVLTPDGKIWSCLTYVWIPKGNLRAVSIICEILLTAFCLIILLNKKEIGPEDIFLLLSVIGCVLFTFTMPVFRVPDEINHYLRTYSILKGYFVIPPNGSISCAKNLVPSWLNAPYKGAFSPYITVTDFNYIVNYSKYAEYNIVNMALYNPISYCFTVVGIGVTGLFTNNLYFLMWGGRLANAIGCTLLLYFAIKIIPYGKGILTLVSILPMNLQERASLSVDAITYASVVLLVAYVLYLRFSKVKIGWRQIVITFLLIMLVASCKIVYVVFSGLIILIPKENYSSNKKAIIHKTTGLISALLLSLGWLRIATRYLYMTNGGENSADKVVYIILNPLKYCTVMINTIAQFAITWIKEMIAYPLGHLEILVDNRLFLLIVTVLLIYLIMSFISVRLIYKYKWDICASGLLLLCSLIAVLLIFTSLYVQWTKGTPESIEIISGIQGRYFLPVLVQVLLAFVSSRSDSSQRESRMICIYANVLMFVFNLLVLLQVFLYFNNHLLA